MNNSSPSLEHPAADPIAEEAAERIVQLTTNDPAARSRALAEFEAWKQADPRHAAAAASMESLIRQIYTVRGHSQSARSAIDAGLAKKQGRPRFNPAKALITLLLILALPTGYMLQAHPLTVLTADIRTAAGEFDSQILSDGTHISINTASAVNLHYDAKRRGIELLRGEIYVDVAKDASRPFMVETEHASIRALGTRFIVRREDGYTLLTMLESKTAVKPATYGIDGLVVSAGQQVMMTADDIGPLEKIDVRNVQDAWKSRKLMVQNQPLAEVLDELNRYHPGRIQYDRDQIAGIKVSAVLPLDDTNKALQLLHRSFPQLRIRTLTRYLVIVDAPRDS